MEGKPSVYHIFIANKLKERCDEFTNIIGWGRVRKIMARSHIPHTIHTKFLAELELYGLIRIKNKRKIIILR